MVRKFENLRVWQIGMDFVEEVFEVSANFPNGEIYGLTNQIRRVVISIPSNISEGCGKRTDKDFVRYLYNALESVKEVKCQLMIAVRLKFLKEDEGNELVGRIDGLAGMLMKFIKKVSDKKGDDEI